MSNNLSPKLKLLKLLTLSSSIILEDNSPLNSLISNCSDEEIKKLIKLKIPEKFLFFYLNNEIINDYLYKVDDVQFDLENFQNNFLNYFYLDLLIAFNKDFVIYMYEIETIQYLNNQEIKGNLKDVIIWKIISDLLYNYKNRDNYENNQDDVLDIIENNNSKRIKSVESYLKQYNIEYMDKDLDILYIDLIINTLLKSNKIEEKNEEDKKYIKQLVYQLNLDKIDLTKPMFEELYKYLKEKGFENYKISNPEDLYDEKKINFYYYLAKYILKRNYFIYNITYLYELKKKLIEYIKNKNIKFSQFKNNTKINEEKIKYFIDFYTDSEYYYEKTFRKDPEIIPKNENNQSLEYKDTSESDFDYSILTFQRVIMSKDKIKTKEIIELSNGYFLKLDIENNIILYDKNFTEKSYNIKHTNYIKNILSLPNDSDNNKYIRFVVIEYNNFVFYKINTENDEISKYEEKQEYLTNQYFEINNGKSEQEKDYIISGNSGIYRINTLSEEQIIKISSDTEEENFVGAIKVSDNIYSFTSNEILNKGKNILKLYDINKEKEDNINPKVISKFGNNPKDKDYSFSIDNNGLSVIDLDNYHKILLCACDNYLPCNKTGILGVRIDVKDFSTSNKFNYTNDFEVYCFCPIYENKKKNFAYVLVGGLEIDKRRNNIKLYKVYLSDENIKIEFIQDAIEDFNGFGKFEGKINKIIRPKENDRYIIVNCTSHKNYLFTLPENDKYVEIYEGLN